MNAETKWWIVWQGTTLTNKWSVCYYSPEPSTAGGNFCYCIRWVQRGERELTVVVLFFSFPLFVCSLIYYFPPHRPYAGIFLLIVLFLSVKQHLSSCGFSRTTSQLSSSCCFVRATGIWSSSARSTAVLFFLQSLFSDLLHHIPQNTCRLFCFVLLCFCFVFSSFFFALIFIMVCALFCCVLVSGTLAFHLFYLGELRLFGLLCFTISLWPHNLYLSINGMKNQHGLCRPYPPPGSCLCYTTRTQTEQCYNYLVVIVARQSQLYLYWWTLSVTRHVCMKIHASVVSDEKLCLPPSSGKKPKKEGTKKKSQ